MEAIDRFISQAYEDGWGWWGFPLGVLALFILLYFVAFRPYSRFLYDRYDYRLVGWPALIAMGVYFLTVASPETVGLERDIVSGPDDDMVKVGRILLWGIPGMALITIHCLVKTRNLLIAVINIPIMYVVTFLCGYLFALVLFAVVAFTLAKGAFAGGRYRCSNCGARVSGGGSCPSCGAVFRN